MNEILKQNLEKSGLSRLVDLTNSIGVPIERDAFFEEEYLIKDSEKLRQEMLQMKGFDVFSIPRKFPKSLCVGSYYNGGIAIQPLQRDHATIFDPMIVLDDKAKLKCVHYNNPWVLLKHESLMFSNLTEHLPVRKVNYLGNFDQFGGREDRRTQNHLLFPIYSPYYCPTVVSYLYNPEENMFYLGEPDVCKEHPNGVRVELEDIGDKFGTKSVVVPAMFTLEDFTAGVIAPYELPTSIGLAGDGYNNNYSPIPIAMDGD